MSIYNVKFNKKMIEHYVKWDTPRLQSKWDEIIFQWDGTLNHEHIRDNKWDMVWDGITHFTSLVLCKQNLDSI